MRQRSRRGSPETRGRIPAAHWWWNTALTSLREERVAFGGIRYSERKAFCCRSWRKDIYFTAGQELSPPAGLLCQSLWILPLRLRREVTCSTGQEKSSILLGKMTLTSSCSWGHLHGLSPILVQGSVLTSESGTIPFDSLEDGSLHPTHPQTHLEAGKVISNDALLPDLLSSLGRLRKFATLLLIRTVLLLGLGFHGGFTSFVLCLSQKTAWMVKLLLESFLVTKNKW